MILGFESFWSVKGREFYLSKFVGNLHKCFTIDLFALQGQDCVLATDLLDYMSDDLDRSKIQLSGKTRMLPPFLSH